MVGTLAVERSVNQVVTVADACACARGSGLAFLPLTPARCEASGGHFACAGGRGSQRAGLRGLLPSAQVAGGGPGREGGGCSLPGPRQQVRLHLATDPPPSAWRGP